MTNEERKVIELALEALEGFIPYLPLKDEAQCNRYDKAITAIKEALAQPEQDQDEVDIRSRLYQRIHELETQLAQPEQKNCEYNNGTCTRNGCRVVCQAEICRKKVEAMEAQPEQEPVAYLSNKRQRINIEIKPQAFVEIPTVTDWEMPLYMKPQQRTWVGLTEEDIDDAEIHLTSCRNNHESWIEGIQEFAQAIEAKLKEKNHA